MNETKPSLQLGRIILKNFKKYEGDITIDLSRDLDKTITVIQGGMGRGKTTILGAIYWCLYGENRQADIENDEGIINKNVLNGLGTGDSGETLVEIDLYEEDQLCYKIRRVIEFSKESESTEILNNVEIGGRISRGIGLNLRVELSHLPHGSDDWQVLNDSDRIKNTIDKLFPKSLSKYFLFDAEMLDKFFDVSDEKNIKVKDGIEKISGLSIVDNTINHLHKTSDYIVKDLRDVNLEPIRNTVILLKKKQEKLEEDIKTETQKQTGLNNELETIEGFLRRHNEELVARTQEQLDLLKEEISQNKKRLKEHKNKMNDWVLRHNILIRLNTSIKKSTERCNTWESVGKIPVAVSGLALKNILKKSPPMCICGAHLDEGTDARRHIEELLKTKNIDSPLIQNITAGRARWDEMLEQANRTREEFRQLQASRDELDTIHHEKYDKRRGLEKEFENVNIDEIHEKYQRQKNLRNDLSDSYQKLGSKKSDLEKTERELSLKDRDLTDKMRRDDKHSSQINRRDLARTLEKVFTKYRDELKTDLRKIVASKTTEYFLKLVSKKDDFDTVDIRENYKTVVLDKDGKIKSLSAGQSCCLALAYIAAIRETADKNYFMMIDSPLHNISQAERVDIAKNLPKFIPQTQITLLVQDQEYTGRAAKDITGEPIQSVRETLKDNDSVWKEYVLKKYGEDGKSSCTKVEDVGT